MGLQIAFSLYEIVGTTQFFWFVFLFNVGLFILVMILLRLTYSTYATCPIHHCEVQYMPPLDTYYCKLCTGYVASPEFVKR